MHESQRTHLDKGHDFNCTFWYTVFGRNMQFISLNGKRGKNKERARTSIYRMDVLLCSIISKTRNSCISLLVGLLYQRGGFDAAVLHLILGYY